MGMGMGMNRPRAIDAGTPPERYARGWHCLGLADTFRDGEPGSANRGPHAVQAFGTKLVVFADSGGRLQQPEEPGLGECLDRLGRHDPVVLGLLGPPPEHREQVGYRGDNRRLRSRVRADFAHEPSLPGARLSP